jgi:hypothetical protein
MSGILHLARTDLRRWRWPLIGWLLLVVMRVLIEEVGLPAARPGRAVATAVEALAALVPATEVLFFCLLVSLIAHETPLVGTDAFWLTRPIDRRHLLAAKLLTLGPALVIWPELGDVVQMFRRGMPGAVIALAALDGVLWRFLWLLVVLVFAALTPSPIRFVLALAGAMLALAATLAGLIAVVEHLFLDMPQGLPPPPVPDSTGALVLLLVSTTFAAAAVVHQFLTRRRGRSTAIALVGLVILPFFPDTWAWPRLRADEPQPPSWALDPARTPLELQTPIGVLKEEPPWRTDDEPRLVLAADLAMSGVPEDYFVEVLAAQSRFTLPDGGRVEGRGGWGVSVSHPARAPRVTRENAWQRVVGTEVPPVGPPAVAPALQYEQWPLLATIRREDAERLQQAPTEYFGSFDIRFWHYRAAATFTLGPAVFRNGSQVIEILDVVRRQASCTLVVRRSSVSLMLRPEVQPEYMVVLRHRARGDVITGQPDDGGHSFSLLGTGGFSVSYEATTAGLVTRPTRLRFPAWGRPGGIEATWFDHAEIVIVETRYAGRATREWSTGALRVAREESLGLR